MIKNGFELNVNGKPADSAGYVRMRHGEVYGIDMHNHRPERCDARVEVDGKHVGTFRISSYMRLERPTNDTGRFTFYREGSSEALASRIADGAFVNGLISVTFTPELRVVKTVKTSMPEMGEMFRGGMRGQSLSSGGTGLSGHSGQSFVNVGSMPLNESERTVINVRLVCDNETDEPRPLRSVNETPVPPRVA